MHNEFTAIADRREDALRSLPPEAVQDTVTVDSPTAA